MTKRNEIIEQAKKLTKSNADMSETIYNNFKTNDKFVRDIAKALYEDNNEDGVKFIKVITDIQKFCIQTNRSMDLLHFLIQYLVESNLDDGDTDPTIKIENPEKNWITWKDIVMMAFILVSWVVSAIAVFLTYVP